jgi:hypothetical protein
MKHVFFIIVLLLNCFTICAQTLPMPFPTDTTDWVRSGNEISKTTTGLHQRIYHETSKGRRTYAQYHPLGNVALVNRSEWNDFWQLFNEVETTEEITLYKVEKSGFSSGEPHHSELNFSKLKSSGLEMKTVFFIVLGSTIHYYSFVITDRLFFVSHSIMYKQ